MHSIIKKFRFGISDKYNLKMVVKVFTTLLFFRYFIFKMADIIVFYFRLIEFENGR